MIENIEIDLNTYILLLKEIMPKFYPQIIHKIENKSLDSIIKCCMISDGLFEFLNLAFKSVYKSEDHKFALSLQRNKGLNYSDLGCSEQLSLNNGEGYLKVIQELNNIENSKKLVEIIDIIGLLSVNIGLCIDNFYPDSSLEITTDNLISIFCLLLIKSSLLHLPSYIKLINSYENQRIAYFIQILEISIKYLCELNLNQ